jgi:hypothetical protein
MNVTNTNGTTAPAIDPAHSTLDANFVTASSLSEAPGTSRSLARNTR